MASIGFIYALIAALLLASYALLAKRLLQSSSSPLVFLVVYSFWGALGATPILLFEPWQFSDLTPTILFITFCATIGFGLMMVGEFLARKHLEASRLTILFQLIPLVAFFGGIFLLGESITLPKLMGVALILVGNCIALYKSGGIVSRNGLLLGAGAVIAAGLAYVADKVAFSHYPIGLYVLITYLLPGVYIYSGLRLKGNIKNALFVAEAKHFSWKLPLLAFINVLGYYFILKAFTYSEASVALPLVYSSSILTVLGGIFILKENKNIPQKLIGIVLVFCGVLFLKF
jgi:drug/metabolite transporter (DMT)-like permease